MHVRLRVNGICDHPDKPDETDCDDDGNTCTYGYCVNGTCDHPDKPDGTSCADDGNPCTYDYCVGGSCAHPAKPDGTACPSDGQACTNDVCNNGFCTHPAKCPAGEVCCGTQCCAPELCCAGAGAQSGDASVESGTAAGSAQFCCALPCNECIDHGSLSGGTIDVNPGVVCVGDAITFTVSGVTDGGGLKRENCAEASIPPGTVTYTWEITKPDGSTLTGAGDTTAVVADLPGTYSVTFTATVNRECPPPTRPIGPGTGCATGPELTETPLAYLPENSNTVAFTATIGCGTESDQIRFELVEVSDFPGDAMNHGTQSDTDPCKKGVRLTYFTAATDADDRPWDGKRAGAD